jgi:hypothetical protein
MRLPRATSRFRWLNGELISSSATFELFDESASILTGIQLKSVDYDKLFGLEAQN